jgi:PPM family protein phosphatase
MQHLIALQKDHQNPHLFYDLPHILYYCKKSPLTDTVNEDGLAIFAFPQGYVLAVADGAGGYPKGEDASAKILSNLKSCFESKSFKFDSLRAHIVDTIDQTNKELLAEGIGARTTLTVCEVVGGLARVYQVGDSGALICGQKGKLKYKSTSHSPVGYGIEAGLIDEAEALTHPDLSFVSNLLGESEMKIEIGPKIELSPNDSIFLASDGIFDNFSPDQLVELVRKGSMESISSDLIKAIDTTIYQRDQAKKDDISFILFKNEAV